MDINSANLTIRRIINSPVNSNCYIIYQQGFNECILVDPACYEGRVLEEHLMSNELLPELIILTHEHFDHISSVEYLREKYLCKVVASAACSESIGNSKKNLSIFYGFNGFSCSPADIIINEGHSNLIWQNISIRFYITPGHSKGSVCFSLGHNLFTGDTLLPSIKTVVKLPGGSKDELAKSLEILAQIINKDTIIFPGHGEIFNHYHKS